MQNKQIMKYTEVKPMLKKNKKKMKKKKKCKRWEFDTEIKPTFANAHDTVC